MREAGPPCRGLAVLLMSKAVRRVLASIAFGRPTGRNLCFACDLAVSCNADAPIRN
jgi:hypothetical protein